MVDLPCYSIPAIKNDFRQKILECCKNEDLSDEEKEIFKISVPLTDNPNAPDEDGFTPIYWAALKGHTEIVKILAPLTDNSNAPDNYGRTLVQRWKNV